MVQRGGQEGFAGGGGDRRDAGEGLLAGEKCGGRTSADGWAEHAAGGDCGGDFACAEGLAGGGGEQGCDLQADGAAAGRRGGVCGADEDGSGDDADAVGGVG